MKINKVLEIIALFLLGIIIYLLFTNINKNYTEVDIETSTGKITQENNIGKVKISTGIIYERAGLAKNLKGIDIKLPDEKIFKLAGTYEKDLKIWLKILPKEDQNKDKYLVLPKEGLIIPINHIEKNSSEYNSFINGKKIDFNKYLENGTIEIPGTSKNGYGEEGNKVISGHSSYFSNNSGRYKTHFQRIIEMNPGEQIWVYEKNNKDKFDRYTYIVEKSYNTKNNDISIIKPEKGKKITLFTCTPIGGISGRWIVKGKFLAKY